MQYQLTGHRRFVPSADDASAQRESVAVGNDNAAADDAVDAVEGEKRVTEHPADKGRGAGCTAFGARQ